jgi:hypothetical protein
MFGEPRGQGDFESAFGVDPAMLERKIKEILA